MTLPSPVQSGLFSTPLKMNPEAAKIPIEQITEEKKNELLQEYSESVSLGTEKRKPGRPRGSTTKKSVAAESAPPPAPAIDAASMERMKLAVVKLTGFGLDWLSPRMPTKIDSTQTEKQMIGEPLAEVLVEFIPNLEANFKYIALLTGIALWLTPRMEGYDFTGKNKKRDSDIRKDGEGEKHVSEKVAGKIEAKRDPGPAA